MDPRQLLSRLSQLTAEGDAIMKQLMASGMPQEQIMAALSSGGQQPPMPQPGMGGPPPMPAPQGPMPMNGGGGGMPPGLLGPM